LLGHVHPDLHRHHNTTDFRQTCWVMFTQTYTDTTTPRTSDRLAGSCSPRPTQDTTTPRTSDRLAGSCSPRPTQTPQHHGLQTDLLGCVHPDLHKTPQHHGLQTDLLGHVHPDLHGLQTDLLCGLLQRYSRLTQVSQDRSFAENRTGAGCLQGRHSASQWFFTLHH